MAKRRDEKKRRGPRILRGFFLALSVLGMGSVSVLGWQWMRALRCERIELHGFHHADSTALIDLARVDTGMVLVDIDPALVADRVRRHPWVETARATRLPTGTLTISVQERIPVVLVLDRRGAPGYFLDRAGFAMPPAPGAVYDVPLLRGWDRPHDRAAFVLPLQDEHVRDLLGALADADDETDALVSELEIQPSGEVVLHTTPVGTRSSIPVRLGRDGFAEKLARLRAFWHQAVLPQPDKSFALIDLRFNSQIVTRETGE